MCQAWMRKVTFRRLPRQRNPEANRKTHKAKAEMAWVSAAVVAAWKKSYAISRNLQFSDGLENCASEQIRFQKYFIHNGFRSAILKIGAEIVQKRCQELLVLFDWHVFVGWARRAGHWANLR